MSCPERDQEILFWDFGMLWPVVRDESDKAQKIGDAIAMD